MWTTLPTLSQDTTANRVTVGVSELQGVIVKAMYWLVNADTSSVSATPGEILADGIAHSQLVIIPRASNGALIGAGQNVQVSATSPATLAGGPQAVHQGDGTYLSYASASDPGLSTVTVTINGLVVASQPQVLFTPTQPNHTVIHSPAPHDFLITTSSVAYNSVDNEYLVVWFEQVGQPGVVSPDQKIFGQRLDGSTGAPIGSLIDISGSLPIQNTFPSIAYASNLNRYLVVWARKAAFASEGLGDRIAGLALNANGTPLNGMSSIDFGISPFGGAPSVASDGNGWYVTWSASLGQPGPRHVQLRGAFVNPDGTLGTHIDPNPINTSGHGASNGLLTYTGSQYISMWSKSLDLTQPAHSLEARTIQPGSGTLGPIVTILPSSIQTSGYLVSGGGGKALFLWKDAADNSLEGQVATEALAIETGIFEVASGIGTGGFNAAFTASSGSWLTVYQQGNGLNSKLVSASGHIGDENTVSQGTVQHRAPSVAWNSGSSNEVMTTFTSGDSSPFALLGQRVPLPAVDIPFNFTGLGASESHIAWTWNDIPNDTGYQLHDQVEVDLGTTPSNTTLITEGGLSENTLYTRHVHAVFGTTLGGASTSHSAYTLVRDPTPSDIQLSSLPGARIQVTITPPPNATEGLTSCRIERSPDGIAWPPSAAVPAPIKDFSDPSYTIIDEVGLQVNTTYYYRFQYRNGDGVSTGFSQVVSATTVDRSALFIVGTSALSSGDVSIRDQLEGLFFAVSIADDDSVTPADTIGHDVVVISSTVDPQKIGTQFRDVTAPVMTCDYELFPAMALTDSILGSHGSNNNEDTLHILRSDHPISGPLTGQITVVNTPSQVSWGIPFPEADLIAGISSNPDLGAVFAYEKESLINGVILAPARRVGFFLHDDTASHLDSNGQQLFSTAIEWLVQPPQGAIHPPMITFPSGSATVIDNTPVITGTSEAEGLTIAVFLNSTLLGETTTGTDGSWSFAVDSAIPDGMHALTALASDESGTSNEAPLTLFTVDTPASPIGTLAVEGHHPIQLTTSSKGTVYEATVTADHDFFFDLQVLVNGASRYRRRSFVANTGPTSIYNEGISGIETWTLSAGQSVTFRAVVMAPGIGAATHDLNVTVIGAPTDTVPPAVTNLAPADKTGIQDPRPTFFATVTDSGGSGLAPGSIRIVLNGIAIGIADPMNDLVTYVPPADLEDGSHSFSVIAKDNAGNSTLSEPSIFFVDTTTQTLPIPLGVVATPGDSTVSLSWNPSLGAEYYVIWESITTGGPFESIGATIGTETSFLASGLSNNQEYFYRIQAEAVGARSELSTEVSATPSPATSHDLLLVVGTLPLNSADSHIKTLCENLGYTVSAVLDSASTASTADGKSLVVVSSSSNATILGDTFRAVSTPVLVCDHDTFVAMAMTPNDPLGHGTLSGQTSIEIADPTHPLAAELSGTVQVTSTPQELSWGSGVVGTSQDVAHTAGNSTQLTIYGIEAGDVLVDGTHSPARRTAFFLGESTVEHLTIEGGLLFDAAVRWTAGVFTAPEPNLSRDEAGNPVIRWMDTSEGMGSFTITRATSIAGPFQVIATGVSGSAYTDHSAPSGVTLYYTIEVSGVGGTSAPSLIVALQPPGGDDLQVAFYGRPFLRSGATTAGNIGPWNKGQYYMHVTDDRYRIKPVQVGSTDVIERVPTAPPHFSRAKSTGMHRLTNKALTADQQEKHWDVTFQKPMPVYPGGTRGPGFQFLAKSPDDGNFINFTSPFFKIYSQKRITIVLYFVFMAVPEDRSLQYQAGMGLLDGIQMNDLYNQEEPDRRNKARRMVVDKWMEGIGLHKNADGVWTTPKNRMRLGWEQANIAFYAQYDNSAYGVAKFMTSIDDHVGKTGGGLGLPADSIPGAYTSPFPRYAKRFKDEKRITVCLVGSIEGAEGLVVKEYPNVVFIHSRPTRWHALTHELGHCFNLRSTTKDFEKGTSVTDALINNPLPYYRYEDSGLPSKREERMQGYNLMAEGRGSKSGVFLLTEWQCWKAYQAALNHKGRDDGAYTD